MTSIQMQWNDIAEDICLEVDRAMKESAQEAAKEGAKYLRSNSPVQKGGNRAGRYAKGWRYTTEYGETYIYNQTDWQLTHLLEDGHDVKNRFGGDRVIGHWGGKKHISNAEGYVYGILDQKLKMRISRGLK